MSDDGELEREEEVGENEEGDGEKEVNNIFYFYGLNKRHISNLTAC